MEEDLQKRCEHSRVRLEKPNYSYGGYYGLGTCLDCKKNIIIHENNYKSTDEKKIYQLKEE